MREVFVARCKKPGRETYYAFMVRNESLGQRIFRMLHALADEGVLDENHDYIVVGIEPDMVQVMVVLAFSPGRNHDEVTRNINLECALRLSLQVSLKELEVSDHDDCRRYAQQARAQEN